jgi:DnaJ-class molecular chaperone
VADYFQALGVPRTATRVDVRRAHAALLQTFSDEALGETVRDTMAPQLRELRYALSEAARVLSDDALRTTYLAHLEPP